MSTAVEQDSFEGPDISITSTCFACGNIPPASSSASPPEKRETKPSNPEPEQLSFLHVFDCGHRLCHSCKTQWEQIMKLLDEAPFVCPFCGVAVSSAADPHQLQVYVAASLPKETTKIMRCDVKSPSRLDVRSGVALAYEAVERTMGDWLCRCKEKKVQIRCNECKSFLCEECHNLHQKFIITKEHVISKYTDFESSSFDNWKPSCFFHLDRPWERLSFNPDGQIYELCEECARESCVGWPMVSKSEFFKTNACALTTTSNRIQKNITLITENENAARNALYRSDRAYGNMFLELRNNLMKEATSLSHQKDEAIERVRMIDKSLEERAILLDEMKKRDLLYLEMISFLEDNPHVDVSPHGLMVFCKLLEESKSSDILSDISLVHQTTSTQREGVAVDPILGEYMDRVIAATSEPYTAPSYLLDSIYPPTNEALQDKSQLNSPSNDYPDMAHSESKYPPLEDDT